MTHKSTRGFISILLLLAIVAGIFVLGGAGWWATQLRIVKNDPAQEHVTATTSATTTATNAAGAQKSRVPTEGSLASVTATSSTKSFLEFVSPVSDTRVSALGTTNVEWRYTDPEVAGIFSSKYTYVRIGVINSEGKSAGFVGDGYLISKTSALWGIQSNMNQMFYSLADGGKYKLHAQLVYSPNEASCRPDGPGSCIPVYSAADQALIDEAKQYQSDSDWFTVHLDGYARPTATIDSGSSVSGTATGVSQIKLQFFSEATSSPPAINTTVTVPVLNGKWSYAAPFPAGTYNLNVWDTSGFVSLTSGSFVI